MQIIKNDISILYCPMNKRTGEFITARYEPTTDVFEAIGWKTKELCKQDIQNMDEPSEWTIVTKMSQMTIIK